MRVLVSDTSVLIDLERGGLLEAAFRLSWEFAVPDLLYKRELRDFNGPDLLRLGLRVEALDPDGIQLALDYQTRVPTLSLPDTFALALAKINGWILLAGDGDLRRLAAAEEIDHHGVLWVLDQLLDQARATPDVLHAALSALAAHRRCRLPAREIRERLERFARLKRGAKE